MIKGDAGRCEPWVPLGIIGDNKVQTATNGETGRESTGLSERKGTLKMPVHFLVVWHKGVPSMKKREIKRGFRRRASDNLILRTPVGHSKGVF